jgi:hypothetical protein
MWTISKVKDELPTIKVKHNGKIYDGQINGRRLDFPRVTIKVNGEWIKAEFAWQTLVNCLNTDKPALL